MRQSMSATVYESERLRIGRWTDGRYEIEVKDKARKRTGSGYITLTDGEMVELHRWIVA